MVHPTLRRCIFWAHLAVGVVVGLVILLLAVTGLLMSFETQIVNRAERIEPSSWHALNASVLLEKFQAAEKGHATQLVLQSHPYAPWIVQMGKEKRELIDPYTGALLGGGAEKTRGFFKTVVELHRWLALKGDAKKVGESVTAAGTLGFGFLLVSGLILWVPRQFSKRAFGAVMLPQSRLKGRARDWNWHNLAGFWAAPFILIIVVTGLIMAYPWANKALFGLYGEKPPEKKQEQRGQGKGGKDKHEPLQFEGLDAAVIAVKNVMPAWQTMSIELSNKPTWEITAIDAGRGRPDRRIKFMVDRTTAQITAQEGFEKLTPAARVRQFVRWVHTGEAGGVIGQCLAALTASAILVLVCTGFALAWRRFAK